MIDIAKTLEGKLATVTITYGEGKTFTAHGRLGAIRELAVSKQNTYLYTETPNEALKSGNGDRIAPWVYLTPEHGGIMAAPGGSRGVWGSQARGADFELGTLDWIVSLYNWQINLASAAIKIEPLTAEGERWIAQNLSTEKRQEILTEKLEKLAPELVAELDELLWRTREDAKAEERSNDF